MNTFVIDKLAESKLDTKSDKDRLKDYPAKEERKPNNFKSILDECIEKLKKE